MPRFTYATVASVLHDAEAVARITEAPVSVLESLDGAVGSDPDAVVVATGGTEAGILDLWADRGSRPLLLVTHPDHNSLPAALEALARIHQLGGRGRIVYLDGTGEGDAMGEAVLDLDVWRRLHDLRIGLLGAPSDWLVASSPEAEVVRRVWGPEVIPVDLSEIEAGFAPVATDGADDRPPEEMAKAMGLVDAIRSAVDEHGLDAVTVRCFDLIPSLATTGCLALSRLNDDGVLAGCEGDLVALIAMVWTTLLIDELPWMANPSRVEADGVLRIAHCTVPATLVSNLRHDTHFESGTGVGLAGEFERGPATLIRIGGSELDQLWVAEGTIVDTGNDPGLCRTQVAIEIGDEAIGQLLGTPLGNHLVMVRGHHGTRLQQWWQLAVA